MDNFARRLKSGKFIVTTELNPPKGTNIKPLLEKAKRLKGIVDAFNLTDSHRARMAMSPMAMAHRLILQNQCPILQITCRDRNRLAIQSDLLGAFDLGISNLLCMTGDHPSSGDHPEAKPVFDVDAIKLLGIISSLNSGKDMSGRNLDGEPEFFSGAVVNPGALELEKEIRRMEAKVEAGATFFQTQPVYEPDLFQEFIDRVSKFKVPIICGIITLTSARMATNLNRNLTGVSIPKAVIAELDKSVDTESTSVAIAARVIKLIRPMCQGVHIMSLGREDLIPSILEKAEIAVSGET